MGRKVLMSQAFSIPRSSVKFFQGPVHVCCTTKVFGCTRMGEFVTLGGVVSNLS